MKRPLIAAASALAILSAAGGAAAFCGFYVAKADTKLFNKASKVVLVHDDDRTVLTISSDYDGDPKEFAMVVPVPTILEREQIHVTENAILDHLDAYTAPRLVEYFDENPCEQRYYAERDMAMAAPTAAMEDAPQRAKSLGVTIEAQYTVGEYDILILSAAESDGLATWLTENDYKIPEGADRVLDSYIKQGTKFFVAKVNLEEQAKTGLEFLRPLQMAFESPKFMLPIRLGTVNANGKQELFIFALSRTGRIETTNYRTVNLPSNKEVPLFVKDQFGDFYTSMFKTAVERENENAVFLEYAWDMNWCDPCAADPLSREELLDLGAFWLLPATQSVENVRKQPRAITRPAPQGGPLDTFVTRLHLSYDAAHFPEDLQFKETGDRTNFQGRYILNHPWSGDDECKEATAYRAALPDRFEKEAQTLANLTNWDVEDIRGRMADSGQPFTTPKPEPWWRRLWKDNDGGKTEKNG